MPYPPGFEDWPQADRDRYFRNHPGMLAASEVNEMMSGGSKKLTDADVEAVVAVGKRTGAQLTPIPGFVWSRLIRWCVPKVSAGLVIVIAIVCATFLPLLYYARLPDYMDPIRTVWDWILWLYSIFR
jgi:hypothetical protein